jgi:hypothetical protein
MCFNPGPERRVPSRNRYIADAKFCFCKNNKRIIITTKITTAEEADISSEDSSSRLGNVGCDWTWTLRARRRCHEERLACEG